MILYKLVPSNSTEGCQACMFNERCTKSVQAVLNQASTEGWVYLYTICGGSNLVIWLPVALLKKKRF